MKTHLLRDGLIAINFSSEHNFEDTVETKASVLVNAVGRVTVTMLERNLIRLRKAQLLRAAEQPSTSQSQIMKS